MSLTVLRSGVGKVIFPFEDSRRKFISLIFPTSEDCLYSLACVLFLHLQNQKWVGGLSRSITLPTSFTSLIKDPCDYFWRRQWHPSPVLLPGKSHGWRSLVGCSPWGLRVGHDWATSLSLFTFMRWRRKWQPTPVFLPWESQGQGSLVGCHLWGRTESDTTEATQ